MKIYDLCCPKCKGTLTITSEQGLVQCDYCGSTLYIDANNHLKVNAEKIAENFKVLLNQLYKDSVTNHNAIVHGCFSKESMDIHFREKPQKYDSTRTLSSVGMPVCMLLSMIFCCIIFYSIWDLIIIPLFLGLFVGIIVGGIIYGIIEAIVKAEKNAPYNTWIKDRKKFIEETNKLFLTSKFIYLVSEEISLCFDLLVKQTQEYNVKEARLVFVVFPHGCEYVGSVNCPFRKRMNNQLSNNWKHIFEFGVSFEDNDFIFLNVEQLEVFFNIIVKQLLEGTEGKRTRFTIDKDHHKIDVFYDNNKYVEPSINKIW